MIMELPPIRRNIVAHLVPLYNPNMTGGMFFAAAAGLARPMFRVSPKVDL
jgi:hypothetical protein